MRRVYAVLGMVVLAGGLAWGVIALKGDRGDSVQAQDKEPAKSVGTEVVYEYDGVKLKGFVAHSGASGKRPGILVVHEWWGLNQHAKDVSMKLAELGYVAFAVDMYGDGKTVDHPKDAGAMATEVRNNLKTWQGRALAGLEQLKKQPNVDTTKLAAIGYCFGGSTALQLAYTGADLDAVVTFHAALPVPDKDAAKNIKAKLLINHGALDSYIKEETITQFRAALEDAKVDYQLNLYGGAVHSFTVPGIEKIAAKGSAYNAEAHHRSWQAMQDMFKEAFDAKK